MTRYWNRSDHDATSTVTLVCVHCVTKHCKPYSYVVTVLVRAVQIRLSVQPIVNRSL